MSLRLPRAREADTYLLNVRPAEPDLETRKEVFRMQHRVQVVLEHNVLRYASSPREHSREVPWNTSCSFAPVHPFCLSNMSLKFKINSI